MKHTILMSFFWVTSAFASSELALPSNDDSSDIFTSSCDCRRNDRLLMPENWLSDRSQTGVASEIGSTAENEVKENTEKSANDKNELKEYGSMESKPASWDIEVTKPLSTENYSQIENQQVIASSPSPTTETGLAALSQPNAEGAASYVRTATSVTGESLPSAIVPASPVAEAAANNTRAAASVSEEAAPAVQAEKKAPAP